MLLRARACFRGADFEILWYNIKRQAAPSALPLIYQGKDLTCTVFYTSTARCNVQNDHCLDKGNDRVPITIASIWQVGFTDLCRAVHDWPAMSSRHSRKSWYKSQLLYWNVQVNYSISFSNILWTFYNVLPKHVRKTLPLLRPFCESYIVKYFEYARYWSFKYSVSQNKTLPAKCPNPNIKNSFPSINSLFALHIAWFEVWMLC